MARGSFNLVDDFTVGFILESYYYLKSIACNAGIDISTPELNVTILEEFSDESSCSLLKDSVTFGFLFGQSFDLFRLIPEVAQLAHLRSCQEPRHTDPGLLNEFNRLEQLILGWTSCVSNPESEPFTQLTVDASIGGLIQQHALLIFLRVALHGHGLPSGILAMQIETLTDEFISLLPRLNENKLAWTNLMWAMLVTGSCLQNSDHREYFVFLLETQHHQMNTCLRILQILRWVWTDSEHDTGSYGPHGITKVCNTHGVKISMG
jgi:hypothetical protein